MGETERMSPTRQVQRREGPTPVRRQNGITGVTTRNQIGTTERPGATMVVPRHEPTDTQLEEAIRVRAYERYLQRQGQAGSPENDWLEAEREVRSTIWQAKDRPQIR